MACVCVNQGTGVLPARVDVHPGHLEMVVNHARVYGTKQEIATLLAACAHVYQVIRGKTAEKVVMTTPLVLDAPVSVNVM